MDTDPVPVRYWGGRAKDFEELSAAAHRESNLSQMPADAKKPALDQFEDTIDLSELARRLRGRLALITAGPIAAAAIAYGATYLITPTFTAKTSLLPPQQNQSMASSAIASLGSLIGLAGGAGVRTAADQYVALMQSATVSDRLIKRFKLNEVYDIKLASNVRQHLANKVRITIGKKDGLIAIEVDDTDPQRSADLANAYVEELRRISSELAITEAQQRRVFFEQQMQQSKARLASAQLALQDSGFNPGALKSEPKAAAESYAKLKAELTAAEIKVQTLRARLSDGAPEMQQALAQLGAIRGQLSNLEATSAPHGDGRQADYLSRYRDFKYEESLFELFAKQFELAKVDESREGALIQIVDTATPPDQKSKPRRSVFALLGGFLGLLVSIAWALQSRKA
ncbi:Wzz/FepE/Etk N-terminal domain-containing protein [Paucibacter sp. APW11]|uniref:Wzz/FepE/Etk N-terminal domain-containing protein n=1 Tax=Roseateles aquae TaxID=3077235 RepID=A0ABU3PFE8_9BURK|nr:Wzz/FepE/Etk N-terminal domain-containing protein [Paucibacter sp. APW11]MDT9001268.1 Wzz/FepE/Etk N-terminal domain-containing protein [Paucibacter sp. APW11]